MAGVAGSIVAPLLHKGDFERLLAAPSRSRSAHFALHHVAGRPLPSAWALKRQAAEKLSTIPAPVVQAPVDDLAGGHWLGSVVPKRHARRAVTRNLLKRQIRAAVARHAATLPAGLWLVRLKSPFAPQQFPSAASAALAGAARAELDALLAKVR